MSKVFPFNSFRQRRREKTDQLCWHFESHPDQGNTNEPMSNTWLYSMTLDGRIRLSGRLTQPGLEAAGRLFGDPELKRLVREHGTPQLMVEALNFYEKSNSEEAARRFGLMLGQAVYMLETKTYRTLKAQAEQAPGTGLHFIVVDWNMPRPNNPNNTMLRPLGALQPDVLQPQELRAYLEHLIQVERRAHPERLPKTYRK